MAAALVGQNGKHGAEPPIVSHPQAFAGRAITAAATAAVKIAKQQADMDIRGMPAPSSTSAKKKDAADPEYDPDGTASEVSSDTEASDASMGLSDGDDTDGGGDDDGDDNEMDSDNDKKKTKKKPKQKAKAKPLPKPAKQKETTKVESIKIPPLRHGDKVLTFDDAAAAHWTSAECGSSQVFTFSQLEKLGFEQSYVIGCNRIAALLRADISGVRLANKRGLCLHYTNLADSDRDLFKEEVTKHFRPIGFGHSAADEEQKRKLFFQTPDGKSNAGKGGPKGTSGRIPLRVRYLYGYQFLIALLVNDYIGERKTVSNCFVWNYGVNLVPAEGVNPYMSKGSGKGPKTAESKTTKAITPAGPKDGTMEKGRPENLIKKKPAAAAAAAVVDVESNPLPQDTVMEEVSSNVCIPDTPPPPAPTQGPSRATSPINLKHVPHMAVPMAATGPSTGGGGGELPPAPPGPVLAVPPVSSFLKDDKVGGGQKKPSLDMTIKEKKALGKPSSQDDALSDHFYRLSVLQDRYNQVHFLNIMAFFTNPHAYPAFGKGLALQFEERPTVRCVCCQSTSPGQLKVRCASAGCQSFQCIKCMCSSTSQFHIELDLAAGTGGLISIPALSQCLPGIVCATHRTVLVQEAALSSSIIRIPLCDAPKWIKMMDDTVWEAKFNPLRYAELLGLKTALPLAEMTGRTLHSLRECYLMHFLRFYGMDPFPTLKAPFAPAASFKKDAAKETTVLVEHFLSARDGMLKEMANAYEHIVKGNDLHKKEKKDHLGLIGWIMHQAFFSVRAQPLLVISSCLSTHRMIDSIHQFGLSTAMDLHENLENSKLLYSMGEDALPMAGAIWAGLLTMDMTTTTGLRKGAPSLSMHPSPFSVHPMTTANGASSFSAAAAAIPATAAAASSDLALRNHLGILPSHFGAAGASHFLSATSRYTRPSAAAIPPPPPPSGTATTSTAITVVGAKRKETEAGATTAAPDTTTVTINKRAKIATPLSPRDEVAAQLVMAVATARGPPPPPAPNPPPTNAPAADPVIIPPPHPTPEPPALPATMPPPALKDPLTIPPSVAAFTVNTASAAAAAASTSTSTSAAGAVVMDPGNHFAPIPLPGIMDLGGSAAPDVPHIGRLIPPTRNPSDEDDVTGDHSVTRLLQPIPSTTSMGVSSL